MNGPDQGPVRDDLPGPARDEDVWRALAAWRTRRRPFVLATVVGSRGFTPRKPGARMLIAGVGEMVGTIGGGAIELRVIVEARALLERGGTAYLKTHLTQELGMCCGGEMSVFLECMTAAPRLFLFGAGYIAKPLAAIAAGCGFEVDVIDARPEWASEARFPTSRIVLREPDAFVRELATTEEDYAVIVTHDHALDQQLVHTLIGQPLKFLGMIGSVPKYRKFVMRLAARGFSEAQIARLRTPLGADIGAETPEEIAVSVMAEIVAVRRGASMPPRSAPPNVTPATGTKPAHLSQSDETEVH
jgi:xanthine dehydrogenase accessory factor